MTDQSYVYAGVGWWRGGTRGGVIRLDARDGQCRHLTRGLPEETHVQAVTVHPENSKIVYIGTQDGPYRSTDRGEHWERLASPIAECRSGRSSSIRRPRRRSMPG